MGLGIGALQLFIALKRQGFISNGCAIIEMGAQQLDDSFIHAAEDIAIIGALFGVTVPPPRLVRTDILDTSNPLAGAPFSRTFWTWLGLDYASIDIDGTPDSIPLDLNCDEVNSALCGRYNVVTNFGTTEHLANQLHTFKVIHDLAAPGALMVHAVPAGGMLNHGLISYNPKFFWMLGRSNGYKPVLMMLNHSERCYSLPGDILDYLSLFDETARSKFADYKVPELHLLFAFQKIYETPFVAPLDVPTGGETGNDVLCERYWSVFKPNAFVDYRRELLRSAFNAYAPQWLKNAKRKAFGTRLPLKP
jgi:hypothetical protein